VNGDTNPDIYLVHNFYTPQRETGRMDGGLSTLLLGRGGSGAQGLFEVVPTETSGLLLPGDAKALSVLDLNDDGLPDFVATRNNDDPRAFVADPSAHAAAGKWLRVSLQSSVGNSHAIGARVTVQSTDGSRQTAEIAAGGSYLAQSAPYLFFGVPGSVDQVEVHWPDGTASRHPADRTWQHGGQCVIAKRELN
jgi:hypothetical protein